MDKIIAKNNTVLDNDFNITKLITNINTYISGYKNLNDGNAIDIIEYVKSILIPYRVKVTYEHLSCLEKINNLKTKFPKADIKLRFKMILSSNKYKADFFIPIVRQSNGIVIVVEESKNTTQDLICKLLVLPAHEFNPKYKQSEIGKNIVREIYTVYKLKDGTIINLSYDSNFVELVDENTINIGKWIITSKNAFDVSNMIWRGFKYGIVINDVLKQYNDFSFDKLNKEKTYTIGFKHPAFHPFGQPDEWKIDDFELNKEKYWDKSAWFVQSANFDNTHLKENIYLDDIIGLPFQEIIEKVEDLPEYFRKLETSLKTFIHSSGLKTINNTIDIVKHNQIWKNAFLGLIIRSKDTNKTLENSDVLFESSLWQEIRRLVYQLPYIKNKEVREQIEYNFKNIECVILYSYLDFKKHETFIRVFPQYKKYYNSYDTLFNEVIDRIYENIIQCLKDTRFKGVNTASLPSELKNNNKTISDKLFDEFIDIVKMFYQLIPDPTQDKKYKPKKNQALAFRKPGLVSVDKKNIKSLIINFKYSEKIYQILYC